MEVLTELGGGFQVALSWENLLFVFVGVLVGMLAGVLPGIGPIGAMTILLPLTFGMDTASAIIMFAGIYYGAMYGNSIIAILLHVPGEAASVITSIEGYQMTRRGRGGAALAANAVASFAGGTISIIGLMFFAPLLADVAVGFGPPEYFAITVVAFALLARLASGSVLRGLIMVVAGMLIGMVGMDQLLGDVRFTFGVTALGQGIDFVPVAIGLYGVGELLRTAEQSTALKTRKPPKVKFREMLPTKEEARRTAGPIARGGVLGFASGLIPGPAAVVGTVLSRMTEMRVSKFATSSAKARSKGWPAPRLPTTAPQ